MEERTVDIHGLAEHVFLRNPKKHPCALSFDDMESPADLFCFFLDLLCKGLVLKFGDESGRVRISQLSPAQFDEVCACLEAVGVRCIWEVAPCDPDEEVQRGEVIFTEGQDEPRHVMQLADRTPDLEFEEYVFVLRADGTKVKIRFELMRVG